MNLSTADLERPVPYRTLASLARRIVASPAWTGPAVRITLLPDHARERGRATATTISLPRSGPPAIVAHELAHVLTWHEPVSHGPAWSDAYGRLLAQLHLDSGG